MMLKPRKNSKLEYALHYISSPLNWGLCKLRPNSKAPILVQWNDPDRTIQTEVVTRKTWTDNKHGIGLVHEASKTSAFDIDSIEFTQLIFISFGIDLEQLLSGYPRIKGRDGRDKIIFTVPKVLSTIKLVWPKINKNDPEGKPITVFELRGKGGQDVLPPSIHPDTGLPYTWIVPPWDFNEGIPLIPKQLLAIWENWENFKPQFESVCPWWDKSTEKPRPTVKRQTSQKNENIIGKFNAAYDIASILEAHGYVKRGTRWLSPTSSSGIAGVVLFDDKDKPRCYSHHASDPLNDNHAHDAFDLLVILEHNGNFDNAIKAAAQALGITPKQKARKITTVELDALLKKTDKINLSTPFIPSVPELTLFPIPALNELIDFFELLATEPRRTITMQGVIAMVANVCGRIYKSEQSNDSSLFIKTLADTGLGKGYPAKAIKRLYATAGLSQLLGGSGCTSSGAVYSVLKEQPCHIQILDEIGKLYQTSKKQQNGQLADAFHAFTIVYSETDSTVYPKNYSTLTLSKHQIEARGDQFIINPSMSVFGFGTKEQVLNNLCTDEIDDGFLNRFIIATAEEKPLHEKDLTIVKTPDNLVEKIKQVRRISSSSDNLLSGYETAHNMKPNFIIVKFSQEAVSVFKDFKQTISKLEGDDRKLAMRWRENAMRMATGFAAFDNPAVPIISEEIAQWCINYVQYHGEKWSQQVKDNIADNDFHRLTKVILKRVAEGGKSGATERELSRASRFFMSSPPYLRDQAFAALAREDLVTRVLLPSQSGRGRKRNTYLLNRYLEPNKS